MNQLKQIATKLDAFESLCKDNYGLYLGKTGLSLIYYFMFMLLKDKNHLFKAKKLINQVGENINTIKDFGFDHGLAGIGWTIEWLIQNKMEDANSDEILEDLDDEFYKIIVHQKSNNLSFSSGTLGKALFYSKRISACNPNFSRYRNICNQECLVLLIDELNDALLNGEKEFLYDEIVNSSIKKDELAGTLLFLAKIHHTKTNAEIAMRIICAIIKFYKQYFLSFTSKSIKEDRSSLYLIYSYYKAGFYLKDNDLIKSATNVFLFYIKSLHSVVTFSCFEEFIIQKLSRSMENPSLLNKFRVTSSELNTFTILRSINNLPGASEYNWEEGWGF